ncbi:MAG: integration host factor subunit beta [Paludibacteraceae bacterium]|nr:integration host factor subunit beta [Paludibacteraceae bacterium]
MTKAELINSIAIKTGYDKKSIALIVEGMISGIKESMNGGENVYLRGFGSFILKTRKAKVARNIREKTSVAVPEHMIPFFKPAEEFKDAVRSVKANKK